MADGPEYVPGLVVLGSKRAVEVVGHHGKVRLSLLHHGSLRALGIGLESPAQQHVRARGAVVPTGGLGTDAALP